MTDRNVRKLKDRAARYLEKQKFEKALEIYETLARQRPHDAGLLLKAGDINRLMGRNKRAIDAYVKAVDRFAVDGMLLKGIAVCKIILDIDPHHRAAETQLEKLYTSQYGALPRKRGVRSEAAAADDTAFSREMDIAVEVDLAEVEAVSERSLPEIPLLSDLDKSAFVELLARIPLHRFDADAVVVREGELGNSFFIVVEGGVRIVRSPGILLAQLGPGAFFGEMAIIAPHGRRATAVTTESSEILEISRADLDALTGRYPRIFNVLSKFTEERLLQNLMVTSPLFTPFPSEECGVLMAKFESVKFLRGQTIIELDKDAAGLFLIVSGTVEIDCPSGEKASLTEGDIFGESSLLLRTKATATVRAIENTRALLLPRTLFNELIMTHPQILELVSGLQEKRQCYRSTAASIVPRDLISEMDGGGALL